MIYSKLLNPNIRVPFGEVKHMKRQKMLAVLLSLSMLAVFALQPTAAEEGVRINDGWLEKNDDVRANGWLCDLFGIGCPPPPPPDPVGQEIPWGITRINADSAQTSVDESGVIVAIVDTGMDLDHEDLGGLFVWGYSYYAQGASGGFFTPAPITEAECTAANPDPCNDDNGHGTHVAGTIAAQDNTVGVLGVAPQVGLYIIKGLDSDGSGSYSAIAGGIRKAVDGPDGVPGTADDADVISMSLGGSSGTQELEDAVNYALNNDVVVVAATGNDGANPAAYPGVIKVGAVDNTDAIASFSNRGETILAPGVDILSTYNTGGYDTLSGTSMATPHVAGVAALAWAAHPTYTNTQIRDLVEGSADSAGIVDASAVV